MSINITKSCVLKSNKIKHYSTKLSYLHNPGEKPLVYTTLGKLAQNAASKFGDNKAIVSKHQYQTLTYHELLTEADKLAAAFRRIGLKKLDRIGLWAPNLTEWLIAQTAVARAGMVSVGLNPFYQPPEVEYCINKVGLKALVCADKLRDFDYYNNLLKVVPELEKCDPGKIKSSKVPSLEHVIVINKLEKPGTYNFEELIDASTREEISEIQNLQNSINPDDSCTILFTTGTTGTPKAVLTNHFSVVNNGYIFGKRNHLGLKHHTICVQVPFFHIFGFLGGLVAGLTFGSTLVIPSITYNSEKSFDAIFEEQCTVLYGSPTMYLDLIELKRKRKEKISAEIAVIGAALSLPQLLEQMKTELNIQTIIIGYGLTESGGVAFQSNFDDNEEQMLTYVGYIQEYMEVKVIGKKEETVPFGISGEMCVRSVISMQKYWGDEEVTKKTKGEDGWLKTGDEMILEENGYAKFVCRLKEIINRGGENIFPKEIEEVLLAHPDILEVYVIGTPHKRLGEEICACVRIKSDASLSLEKIKAFCKEKISHFKVPSKLEFFDEFPKTANGKVQKIKLREIVVDRTKTKNS